MTDDDIVFVVSTLDEWGGAEVVLRDFIERFGDRIITTRFSPEVLIDYFKENPDKVETLIEDEDYLTHQGIYGTDYESAHPTYHELEEFDERVERTKEIFHDYFRNEFEGDKPVVPLSPLAAYFIPEEYRETAFLHSTYRIFTDLFDVTEQRLTDPGKEALYEAKGSVGEKVKSAVQDYEVITNSEYVFGTFEEYYDITPKRICYPGPDMDHFEPHPSQGDYFLAVQRLDPFKRLDILMKAFAQMPDEKLVVVGDGQQQGYVKKAAKRTDNIVYKEWTDGDELVDLYQNARATIQTCQVEDFGKVPVESLACGTPVIATNRGGFRETVNEDVGELIDLSSDALIEAVRNFNDEKYDMRTCRDRARKFRKSKFLNQISEEFEEL